MRRRPLRAAIYAGATGTTYTVVEADQSKYVRVQVSFQDDDGNDETATSDATGPVAAEAERVRRPGQPTISGTAQVGEDLSASVSGVSDANGLTSPTYSYQWLRGETASAAGEDISGARSATYTVVEADQGKYLRVRVSFQDDDGNAETVTSDASGPVSAEPNVAATGQPTISGTAQVGGELTAGTSGISDGNGLTTVSYSYQWLRGETAAAAGSEISGARSATYTVVEADQGKYVRVQVSFQDDDGNSETATSDATGSVSAEPNVAATGQPTISGTAQVGGELTAGTNGISDENGLTSPTYSYQWLRAETATGTGSEISGARSTTYTVVEADQGKYLRVRVNFQDDDGNAETATSDATGSVSAEPNVAATGQPTISGTAQVGGELTAGTSGISDENGLTSPTYSYQWLRAETATGTGSEISGARSTTYTVVEADQGKYLRVRVNFQDDDGNDETATSDAKGPVAAEPNVAATGQPTISGTAQVGEDLSASVSGISDGNGVANSTYSYQWLRADTATGTGSEISGARSATYTVVEADQSKYLRVQVSFADDDGNDESATSDATGPVAAEPNVAATGQPTISGTAQVGEDLSASVSGISDGNGLTSPTYSYQWLRGETASAAGEDISGARSATYTVVEADQGKYVRVQVSFQDDDGYDETATSDARGPVAAEPNESATGQPTISGTARVGEDLSASVSGISDGNGLTNSTYDYQWLRGETASAAGEDIYGATSATYTVVEADQSKYLRVRVNFQDDDGNAETATSDARGPVAAEPNVAATGQPTISGTARVGEDLSASVSGISDGNGLTSPAYSYQWLRADTATGTGSEIAGGTSATYTVVEADQSKYLRVRVSFQDDDGNSETATSDASGPVSAEANESATGQPTISGTAQVGEDLSASVSGISDGNGLTSPTYSYQWLRGETAAAAGSDIPGATGTTYTVVEADQGKYLRVRVNFQDDDGNAETGASDARGPVAAEPNVAATGQPTISGTAQVGENLSAGTSGIGDGNGLTSPTYSYQWLRGETAAAAGRDIPGATSATYTAVEADQSKYVRVQVSFQDDDGNDESATSDAKGPVAAEPNESATGQPTISGTAQVGEDLTAGTSGISDGNGLTTVSYSYQWLRGETAAAAGSEIAGGTSATYTVVEADQGKYVRVRVNFQDDDGNAETVTSDATGPVSAEPNVAAAGQPTISGTARVGGELTAGTSGISDENGLTTVSYSYQWLRAETASVAGEDISGATGATYTVVEADQGKYLRVRVSFADDDGNAETVTSDATGPVSAEPNVAAAGQPTISGTAQVGQDLTASVSGISDENGLTNPTYSYQWLRAETASAAGEDISGATSSTYILVEADQGKYVRVRVSFADDDGNAETVTSDATGPVSAEPNESATGQPTISGTARVGQDLSAGTSGISDENGLTNPTYSYQWLRVDTAPGTGSEIAGATGNTYTVVEADQGKYLRVRVSFADDDGNSETVTSDATGRCRRSRTWRRRASRRSAGRRR